MRKIGILLLMSGIVMVSWYGYQRWESMQSVDDVDGVVKASGIEERSDMREAPPADYRDPRDPPDFDKGEEVANLVIPKIGKSYDVFWGTDEDTLTKGVGMYVSKWTVPPGEHGHTVLSGHRDTVFSPLRQLQEGDTLYTSYEGQDYQYKINKIWITDADDRTVIVKKDQPTLTLTTCYPFDYIGPAPDRYIIQADLVDKGDLLKGKN